MFGFKAQLRAFKVKRFIRKAAAKAVDKVLKFFVGVYHHAEAITILTLAAIGLNALLGELPFIFMLPMWIEATMVIPVLAVVIISLMVKFMEWRMIRRDNRMVLA